MSLLIKMLEKKEREKETNSKQNIKSLSLAFSFNKQDKKKV